MQLFRYWSPARGEASNREGRTFALLRWGGSDANPADAVAVAQRLVQETADRIARSDGDPDAYPYGQGGQPLREEVLQRQDDDQGRPLLALTRNRYGAIVLNSACAMFVDVDDPPAAAGGGGLLGRMFGKRPPAAPAAEPPGLAAARAWTQAHPVWGWRAYRTKAGLRLLAVHDVFDPTDPATDAVMQALGADPLYRRLCRDQACFRARLTPKPWRIDLHEQPPAFPYGDQAARQERWARTYQEKRKGYATCRFVGAFGSDQVHPAVAPVIALHDQIADAHRDAPLA